MSSSSSGSSGSSSSSHSGSEKKKCHKKKLKIKVGIQEEPNCEEEKVDPLVAAKRKQLQALEAQLKDKEKQYQAENNWLTQAQALIGTLRAKTQNVRLHLNDVHKVMTEMHFNDKQMRRQLQKLEAKSQAAAAISQLEKELAELLSHSENVKQKVSDLQGKKAEYRSRIEEIKKTVADLKVQHGRHKKTSPQAASIFVAQPACNCGMPITRRPHGCSC